MDIDGGNHGVECIALFAPDFRFFQTIIVEYPVVYSFAGSALLHDGFPLGAAPRDFGEQSWVPFRFGIADPPVGRTRAAIARRGSFSFSANTRAAPLYPATIFTAETIVHHRMAGRTKRYAALVEAAYSRILFLLELRFAKRDYSLCIDMV